jgi:hypothetical protein
MPYTTIPVADPQPDDRESPYVEQLVTGEWISNDEVAVELDAGERVAVSCVAANRDSASHSVQLTTTARRLDREHGTALDDSQNKSHVVTSWIHGVTVRAIESAGGLAAIRAECLRIALGEAPTMIDGEPLIPISQEVRDAASIRRAIASAAVLAAANQAGVRGLL